MKHISQFISFQLACNIDISDSRKKSNKCKNTIRENLYKNIRKKIPLILYIFRKGISIKRGRNLK